MILAEEDRPAYEQAVRWLARRPYAVGELRQRLLQKGVAADCCERVCMRCQELGYLDDSAFALSRARYRLHHGGYGPRWVAAELRSLHVGEEEIRAALTELLAEEDLLSLAQRTLQKRFGTADSASPVAAEGNRQQKKRQYAYLARRGFDDEVIWQLIR
ncbi:regulatory protein RecX [Candidatus Magnetaquicoccus inordinatus]|uniref:regulatory protein RecX n=1 Tax=Candidatus Magnetaquicoccus inordinatus TaxID=2496818 RepID=UPI00187D6509|nr:regulatory protein RecX [Candidatus Magnetaquicoccus inordinatus]